MHAVMHTTTSAKTAPTVTMSTSLTSYSASIASPSARLRGCIECDHVASAAGDPWRSDSGIEGAHVEPVCFASFYWPAL